MLITAVRHGQAEHNLYMLIGKRNLGANIHDPSLTNLGRKQAESVYNTVKLLAHQYSNVTGIEIKKHIISISPLKRALETAEIAFPKNSNFYINPDLQELGIIPCDIGSNKLELIEKFKYFDFSHIDDNWYDPKYKKDNKIKFNRIFKWLDDQYHSGCNHVTLISHEKVLLNLFGSLFKNCEVKGYIYLLDGKIKDFKYK
jgi:broad specificity phosphatase PhoE